MSDEPKPIKHVDVWNAGDRCTYDPPREADYQIVKVMHRDKIARRILRRAAFRNGSRIARKLDKVSLVKAACYREAAQNGHAAQRLFMAELLDHAKRRKEERDAELRSHGRVYTPHVDRAERRLTAWPHGRGHYNRTNRTYAEAARRST